MAPAFLGRVVYPCVLSASLSLIACGGSPTRPSAAGSSGPSIATANGAPTVTVGFEGSSTCTPAADKPCTLTIIANAQDPDGDALTFAWSGCASGIGTRATCSVAAEGDVTAAVQVSDGHGHQTNASATAHGMPMTKANAAPTVTVRFDGASSCTPMPDKPCALDITVTATDPDNDSLKYTWDGCAKGTSTRAVCNVSRPGPVTATVAVTDGHGHEVTASATAVGEDESPTVHVGYISLFSTGSLEVLGSVIDPEEGELCGGDTKYCVSVTGSGVCDGAAGCRSNLCLSGLELFAKASAAHGQCTLSIVVQDSFGKHGTTRLTFDLDDPKVRHY